MADFQIALEDLLAYEGGYSNNSNDAGGETVFGIARVFWPGWPGWPLVDVLKREHQNLVELNHALRADVGVMAQVGVFYHTNYWYFDKLESQVVANKMLDMEVNFGKGSAIRMLQEGLVKLGHRIDVDGRLGSDTLTVLQNEKEPEVLRALRALSALHRIHRILSRPDQVQFAEGWAWRDAA